jgi:cyanate permease
MSIVQGIGWALAAMGLAISGYIASTGKWLTLPRPRLADVA